MTDRTAKHRFFAESIAADAVELSVAEAHHARHVLRLREGAAVTVFDGAGAAAEGVFRLTGRKSAVVEVTGRHEPTARATPAVALGFAVPKGKRLDWLIEKTTELGVGVLSPVVFARSVAGPRAGDEAPSRWRETCIAAAKQCGAAFLPQLRPVRSLTGFLADAPSGAAILGDQGGTARVAEALTGAIEAVTILVGPEGGLTDIERAEAVEAGFTPARLGELTLRTETAAIALLAAVRALT